jgi:hypothetical protein
MDQSELFAMMANDAQDDDQAEASASLVGLGQELADAKAELEEAKEAKTAAQKAFDDIRFIRVPEAMAKAGMIGADGKGSYTVPGHGKVHLRNDVKCSVNKANEVEFHTWLKENGFGELIKPTVHASTMKAWAKEQIEAGRTLPEFVKVYLETSASIRKS